MMRLPDTRFKFLILSTFEVLYVDKNRKLQITSDSDENGLNDTDHLDH